MVRAPHVGTHARTRARTNERTHSLTHTQHDTRTHTYTQHTKTHNAQTPEGRARGRRGRSPCGILGQDRGSTCIQKIIPFSVKKYKKKTLPTLLQAGTAAGRTLVGVFWCVEWVGGVENPSGVAVAVSAGVVGAVVVVVVIVVMVAVVVVVVVVAGVVVGKIQCMG